MDPNQNIPSEREWTIEEREEFFASQDAITGLSSGAVANNAGVFDTWVNLFRPTGIYVTYIEPPEQGWPVALYCPICRETTILLSPWVTKPNDGDYFRINEMCGNEQHTYQHNMMFAMQEFPVPVRFGSHLLPWWMKVD